jgi:hypothetical protein
MTKWLVTLIAAALCVGCGTMYAHMAVLTQGDASAHTPAEMETYIGRFTGGYTQMDGEGDEGKLDALGTFDVPLEAGKCYAVVIRLAPGAEWSGDAKGGVGFAFDPLEKFEFVDPAIVGQGIVGPGGGNRLGCPTETGTYEFRMGSYADAINQSNSSESLGAGGYTMEFWSRPVSAEEVETYRAEVKRAQEEYQAKLDAEAREKSAKQAEGCGKCGAQFQGCIGAGRDENTCMENWRSCRFQAVGADIDVCKDPRF